MTATTRPSHGTARALRFLPGVTLLAVLTITASAEYELARTVLDLPPQIAWALPAAIDSYVLAALRTRRDVPAAIAVMAGALLAAMGAHLAHNHTGGQPLPAAWTAPLATAIMTVLVVVAWRVHVLLDPHVPHEAEPRTRVSVAAAPDPDTGPRPVTRPALPSAATPSTSVPDVAPSTPSPSTAPDTPRPGTPAPSTPAARPAAPDTPPVAALAAGNAGTKTPAPVTIRAAAATGPEPASDEQILAAITGAPPSIRALMREHGIGQARATRIHRTATARNSATNTTTSTTTTTTTRTRTRTTDPNTSNDHQSTRNSKEDQAGTPETPPENEIQNDQTETTDERTQNKNQESRTRARINTHTCITDRAGQPRSTQNGVDHGRGGQIEADVAPSNGFADVAFDLAAVPAAPTHPGAGEG